MKQIIFSILIFMQSLNLIAQKITTEKWHTFYIGGNKGFFVKTYMVSKDGLTENQFGSGGQFDNSPVQIKVAELVANGNEERIITDYGDSAYYVILFKNITSEKARVCYSTDQFKTIEEAKKFAPADSEFSDWFTETGFKLEDKKPAMTIFTKADAKELIAFVIDYTKTLQKELTLVKDDDKALGLAFVIATLPSQFATKKGFHAYKSLPVIDKGMNKFKNDPEIKKMIKDADLNDMLQK